MADGVDGLQIQSIIANAVAEFVRIDTALILIPAVEDVIVRVVLHDMLVVTNAGATMGAVSKSVRKPIKGVVVHALLDINPVELHVLVCQY